MTEEGKQNVHASKCILSSRCKAAGTPACSPLCEFYIGVNGRLNAAGIPADYRMATLANSPARENQSQVYANLATYIATFERQFDETNDNPIKSLYLYSESPGTGKTLTASALINEWIRVHYIGSLRRGVQAEQVPAFFLDVTEWQTLFNEFNRPRVPDSVAQPASEKYYRMMERAKKAPFTVFDDLGVRNVTDAFRSDLQSVVNHRVTNKMPSVYTSNLPIRYGGKKEVALIPYDLVDIFGEERLADRIGDLCSVQNFVGQSKRGRR